MSQFLLIDAQRIAEAIVGLVDWNGAEGYCACPGLHRHSRPDASTDCKVVCEPLPGGLKPGIYCYHQSCGTEVEAASFELRSALGKRSPGPAATVEFRMPRPPRPKAEFDAATLRRIAARCPGVDEGWLAARSPKTPWNRTPASFLHELYQPGEKVLVFDEQRSQGQAVWEHQLPPFDARALDHFTTGRAQGVWFLNQPVSGEWVPKESEPGRTRRSWQTVTAWRYLVLESDIADSGDWLSVLVQMPLAVAAITTSGGKSIHALIRVDASSKTEFDAAVEGMKEPLIVLGADQRAMSAVRLTRLPGCVRCEKGRVQTLLYLNAKPDGTPICEMGVTP